MYVGASQFVTLPCPFPPPPLCAHAVTVRLVLLSITNGMWSLDCHNSPTKHAIWTTEYPSLVPSPVGFICALSVCLQEELSRGEGVDRKDMLTLMLTAKDPKSGQTLPDANVRNQILTLYVCTDKYI